MTITSVNKVSITGIVSVLPEISCENIDESSSSAREEMAAVLEVAEQSVKVINAKGETLTLEWEGDRKSVV